MGKLMEIIKVMVRRFCFLFVLLVLFGCGDDSSNEDEIVQDLVQYEIVEENLVEDEVVDDKPAKNIIWEKDGKEMVLIPAGSFAMGDAMNEPEEWMENARPVHKVELDAFYMDIHEVTVGQFREFVNQSGYKYPDFGWDEVAKISPDDDYPMMYVNWNDATAYAEWASKRLPTEAEWEYAARGGLEGQRYPWGDEAPTAERANYNANVGETTIVGSYPANGYDLYDMAGNVWEWCQDWYKEDYYSKSPVNNPQGPEDGSHRVLRGGSWNSDTSALRVDYRSEFNPLPKVRDFINGFRCVSGSN